MTVTFLVLVDEGREDAKNTLSRPSSYKWRFAGVPLLAIHKTVAW